MQCFQGVETSNKSSLLSDLPSITKLNYNDPSEKYYPSPRPSLTSSHIGRNSLSLSGIESARMINDLKGARRKKSIADSITLRPESMLRPDTCGRLRPGTSSILRPGAKMSDHGINQSNNDHSLSKFGCNSLSSSTSSTLSSNSDVSNRKNSVTNTPSVPSSNNNNSKSNNNKSRPSSHFVSISHV